MGMASELERWQTCTCPPERLAASMTPAMARFSIPRGREARKSEYLLLCGAGEAAMASLSSAWTSSGQSRPLSVRSAASTPSGSRAGNSGPAGTMKHLKPRAPASRRASSWPMLSGTAPPQNPTSTWHCPAAARSLASSAATLTVGGSLIDRHVHESRYPPGCGQRGSHSRTPPTPVLPGSQTWTCESTIPGRTTRSGVRCHSALAGSVASRATRATIRPVANPDRPGYVALTGDDRPGRSDDQIKTAPPRPAELPNSGFTELMPAHRR